MAFPRFRFSIDRGGTFCDCVAQVRHADGKEELRVVKLLSEDPKNYDDAPREAIRRVLSWYPPTGTGDEGGEIPRGVPIPTDRIDSIRMGTTVATNALLEREGERTALIVSEGFSSLLRIGTQSRPSIFDLSVARPQVLHDGVFEARERVVPFREDDDPSFAEHHVRVVDGRSGEQFAVRQELDEEHLRHGLEALYEEGYRAVAVVFLHAYAWPEHEQRAGEIAKEVGFPQVSLSSATTPMARAVPRGHTACADAYLTPKITSYIGTFLSGFDWHGQKPGSGEGGTARVTFMRSDGGLAPVDAFSGFASVLSGPAGGVVGCAVTAYHGRDFEAAALVNHQVKHVTSEEKGGRGAPQPLALFDMGGTSTDVSRFAGSLEHVFDSTIAGVTLQAPQLDITTVAAGGGSRLAYRAGLFRVGPESAGAHPGPVCYRKPGGLLAVTDANAVLGRVRPEFFPKIFGPHENEPLDVDAARAALAEIATQVNAERDDALSVEETALGFIRVANEAMCRPIRALTQMRGFDLSSHCLACFGGAGGQHACAVARALGMHSIFVSRFSGVLSAFGLGVADEVAELQAPLKTVLKTPTEATTAETSSTLAGRFIDLVESASKTLCDRGFESMNIGIEAFLNLRFAGTDTSLMIPLHLPSTPSSKSNPSTSSPFETPVDDVNAERLGKAVECAGESFVERYRREFGFVLHRAIEVEDVRVRAVGHGAVHTASELEFPADHDAANPRFQSPPPTSIMQTSPIYFEGGWRDTPVYDLSKLRRGDLISGPALLVDATSTILVEPGFEAVLSRHGDIEIGLCEDEEGGGKGEGGGEGDVKEEEEEVAREELEVADPIRLSLFSHRFMSIAEQMGRTLQRTSISVNIKERLDFSCALFGPEGDLVANAPHIPVHLGAMTEAVRFQLRFWGSQLEEGDVLVSNHPQLAGGSHLPDITVMTPVFDADPDAMESVPLGLCEGGDGSGEGETKSRRKIIFWVASRGHHADIGGIAPGSMPPASKWLAEEGAAIVACKLVSRGEFQEDTITSYLLAPGSRTEFPDSSGTRRLPDVLSDLQAQIAANQRGIELVHGLVAEYSLAVVHAYMGFIRTNASRAVATMLRSVLEEKARERGGGETVELSARDVMDDGSEIVLRVRIAANGEKEATAEFDFAGTSPEVVANTNAPPAVTASAVIYALRCLVAEDIPLNQGCLAPVRIHIPPHSLLNPSPEAAVVGGNVLTSQRVVDVVLRAFEACAASQGCMNNLTFGDTSFGYYETIAGGAGAGPTWDGSSGVHTHMTNTRITDPEVLERRYPVHLRRFHLRPHSGGKGEHPGGDGVIRELQFRKPLTVSILSERRVTSPYGLHGGASGRRGLNLLLTPHHAALPEASTDPTTSLALADRQRREALEKEASPVTSTTTVSETEAPEGWRVANIGGHATVQVRAGDCLRILTPGGGGFGEVGGGSGGGSGGGEEKEEEVVHPPARIGGGRAGEFARLQEEN